MNKIALAKDFLKLQVKYSQKLDRPINFPPFPPKKYQVIYADPPWHYGGKLQHEGHKGDYVGGCVKHYPCVPTPLLAELEVSRITEDDCLLFLWATNPHLNQAIALGQSWGFTYSTVAFVWDKQLHNPGRYTISQCELCLLFKQGKIPSPRGRRNVMQLVSERRSKTHSTKPKTVRDGIQAMFPFQPKIELFARTIVDGWDAWGLELG